MKLEKEKVKPNMFQAAAAAMAAAGVGSKPNQPNLKQKLKPKPVRPKKPFFRTVTSELFEWHGRLVLLTTLPEAKLPGLDAALGKCAECGEPSTMVVTELTDVPKEWVEVWGYCGKCRIKS